jgi:hypothetical protein
MRTRKPFWEAALVMGLVAFLGASYRPASARQAPAAAIPIDADDIGGVVTGRSGPEAGVWVIAETTELPTKFNKIVVTDDRGRYVLPDLPKAHYNVWVRGYGLVDSPKVPGTPGRCVEPDRRSGAESARGGPVLSGAVLVLAHQSSGEE